MSIFATAALFGVLHLGSGRKYSFAVWYTPSIFQNYMVFVDERERERDGANDVRFDRATFVGVVYGYATSLSSSIAVPMASHALNNLVGGLIWRTTSEEIGRAHV